MTFSLLEAQFRYSDKASYFNTDILQILKILEIENGEKRQEADDVHKETFPSSPHFIVSFQLIFNEGCNTSLLH